MNLARNGLSAPLLEAHGEKENRGFNRVFAHEEESDRKKAACMFDQVRAVIFNSQGLNYKADLAQTNLKSPT